MDEARDELSVAVGGEVVGGDAIPESSVETNVFGVVSLITVVPVCIL